MPTISFNDISISMPDELPPSLSHWMNQSPRLLQSLICPITFFKCGGSQYHPVFYGSTYPSSCCIAYPSHFGFALTKWSLGVRHR